jgi:hypothetical protein
MRVFKGLTFLVFIFLINLNTYANEIKHTMQPSFKNLYFIDSHYSFDANFGNIYDDNDNYLGKYVDHNIVVNDTSVKNSLLHSGLTSYTIEASNQAQNQYQAITIAVGDVDDAISKITDWTAILNLANNYADKGVEVSKALIDAWILELKLVSKCNISPEKNICKLLNSASFNYMKSILYAVAERTLKPSFLIKSGTQLSLNIDHQKLAKLSKIFGRALNGVTTGLDIGKILNNLIGSWALETKVIKVNDVNIMLLTFFQAYLYFNQDIDKLKNWIIETANNSNYSYSYWSSYNRKIEDNINSFSHLFFHYIVIMKNTKEKSPSGQSYTYSKLENINLSYIPDATSIAIDLIKRFGNGGNLGFIYSRESTSRDYKFKSKGFNPLYVSPKCSIFKNNKATYLNDCHFSKITGNCTISMSAIHPHTTKIIGYSTKEEYVEEFISVHKIENQVHCSYNLDYPVSDESLSEYSKIDIYVPSYLPDVTDNNFFSKSIMSLANKKIVKGYKDGEFKPKNNVSIGEFLTMITKAIYFNDADNYKKSYDSNGQKIPFSQYINYLIGKGIDIDYKAPSSYTKEDVTSFAKRKYIAQVLASIINKTRSSYILDYQKKWSQSWDGDWDKNSELLRVLEISNGDKDGRFNPDKNITRDEVSVLIMNTMNFGR